MSTPEDRIAEEMRFEIEARLSTWKAERDQLLKAQERIAELDALIAFVEDDRLTQVKIAPRKTPQVDTQIDTTERI